MSETKRPCIRAMQCAMRKCLQKATAVCPNTIFFWLHCSTKPQNYGLVLACSFLLFISSAISLSCVAFHMESENMPFPPPAKAPWDRSTLACDKLRQVQYGKKNQLNTDPSFACSMTCWFQGSRIISAASNLAFWTFFRSKTCCVVCHSYCFCYSATNMARKKVQKTTFDSTSEMIRL